MPDYPAQRFILLIDVWSRQQPAYAPNQAEDHLEAYAPFLHETINAVPG